MCVAGLKCDADGIGYKSGGCGLLARVVHEKKINIDQHLCCVAILMSHSKLASLPNEKIPFFLFSWNVFIFVSYLTFDANGIDASLSPASQNQLHPNFFENTYVVEFASMKTKFGVNAVIASPMGMTVANHFIAVCQRTLEINLMLFTYLSLS